MEKRCYVNMVYEWPQNRSVAWPSHAHDWRNTADSYVVSTLQMPVPILWQYTYHNVTRDIWPTGSHTTVSAIWSVTEETHIVAIISRNWTNDNNTNKHYIHCELYHSDIYNMYKYTIRIVGQNSISSLLPVCVIY